MNENCLVAHADITHPNVAQLVGPDEAVILHHTCKIKRWVVLHRVLPQANKVCGRDGVSVLLIFPQHVDIFNRIGIKVLSFDKP